MNMSIVFFILTSSLRSSSGVILRGLPLNKLISDKNIKKCFSRISENCDQFNNRPAREIFDLDCHHIKVEILKIIYNVRLCSLSCFFFYENPDIPTDMFMSTALCLDDG